MGTRHSFVLTTVEITLLTFMIMISRPEINKYKTSKVPQKVIV